MSAPVTRQPVGPADERGARIIRLFGPTPVNWVRDTGADHDVVVIGGGQAGLGIGFALRRAGILRFSVIDAAAPQDTGVWTTIARMRTLRTPKIWPEPEFGFPELSFRAWYEDRHGLEAYEALGRIPRPAWAEYVDWFARTVDVPVRHHTRLVSVRPTEDGDALRLTLEVSDPAGATAPVTVSETTRKLVYANGVEGTGGGNVPAALAHLPAEVLAHTGDSIDFDRLAGRRVAVLGAGASAFDAAGTALEAGAAEVHLFTRRADLIVQGPDVVHTIKLGGREHFHRRGDADRWRLKHAAARAGRSATLESVQRAAAFPGFRLHLNAGWQGARVVEGALVIEADDGTHEVDFAILGTGYQYDPHTSSDLREIADDIALWRDVYQPPADLADDELGRWPYLGEGYEFTEKVPGTAPWLSRVHVFSAAAGFSFGIPVGDVQSLATGIPRLIDAVGRDLFAEDEAAASPAPPPAPAGASWRSHYEHAIYHREDELAEAGTR